MRVARVALAATATALALTAAAPSPALDNNGTLRVLVILATWGPQPFSRADGQQAVFGAVDAFIRENSYGKASLTGEVTPWVQAFPSQPRCSTPSEQQSLADAAKAAAKQAGFAVASYSRFLYLFPGSPCGYGGWGSIREAFINGSDDPRLIEHELGHTFGLSHAHAIECSGTCEFVEYGDAFDTMGSGFGDYNTYEKHVAGWLTNEVRARRTGTYTIEALEAKSDTPQAFVVQTARNELWFDHRAPILNDAHYAGSVIVNGLELHAGPPSSDPTAASDWNTDNTLVRRDLSPGHTYTEQGAFRLTVLSQVDTHVVLRFTWTDTTKPARPRFDALDGRIASWEPAVDAGSGIDRYTVSVDGRARAAVRADFTVPLRVSLTKGRHTVAVTAVDRAGNRSAAARRTFTVR